MPQECGGCGSRQIMQIRTASSCLMPCLKFTSTVSTVAHKCTPHLNHSHQINITPIEVKSLTLYSNRSHWIQITHTEFKSLTPTPNSNHSHRHRIQITRTYTEFKSFTPTPNSNHSHRIQIFTPNWNLHFLRSAVRFHLNILKLGSPARFAAIFRQLCFR